MRTKEGEVRTKEGKVRTAKKLELGIGRIVCLKQFYVFLWVIHVV